MTNGINRDVTLEYLADLPHVEPTAESVGTYSFARSRWSCRDGVNPGRKRLLRALP